MVAMRRIAAWWTRVKPSPGRVVRLADLSLLAALPLVVGSLFIDNSMIREVARLWSGASLVLLGLVLSTTDGAERQQEILRARFQVPRDLVASALGPVWRVPLLLIFGGLFVLATAFKS
jgi:hypothetical protein